MQEYAYCVCEQWGHRSIALGQIFVLFLHEKICCGYSLEASCLGALNEYPQHTFSWRMKKKTTFFCLKKLLSLSYADRSVHPRQGISCLHMHLGTLLCDVTHFTITSNTASTQEALWRPPQHPQETPHK